MSPTIDLILVISSGYVAAATSMQLPFAFHCSAAYWATICQSGLPRNCQGLEVARAGIRCPAEYDAGFVGVIQKGLQGIATQVGTERDRVKAQIVKDGSCVGSAAVADVAALGVADGQDIGMM